MRRPGRPQWARRLWRFSGDTLPHALLAREKRRGRFYPDAVWWCADRWEDAVRHGLCAVFGHSPTRDQCGRPEHDFCLWCSKTMPGAADGGAR